MTHAPAPRFRILGPLEVRGARPLRLAAARQRIVLAMLLLEANQVVPVARLVDAVWEDAPPRTARAQVQICVSAIRQRLEAAGVPVTVVTRPPGYLLQTTGDDLDLHVFDRLVGQARQAQADQEAALAAETYRQALALCTGQPLAGLDSRVVRSASVRLAERVIAVREECIELELALGRHRDLVAELRTLVADHPLRERLRGHLMVALYRSGRQAEALAAYREARDDLVEELGLEPGGELRRLERAILAGNAELDLSTVERPMPPRRTAVPQLLPADITDFVGRTAVLDKLRQALTTPAEEALTPPVVAISGRGGVGKSALAVHLAHLVRTEFPDGQLFAHLHGTEHRPASPGVVLERFLRSLGVTGTAIPDDPEDRAAAYRDLVAHRRVLVVLDDAADERQIRPLLPGSPRSVVILTSRLRLTDLPGTHDVDLDVFDGQQAIDLVTRVIGAERVNAEPESARELVDLCGRLPLALRIAAARLTARPHWPISQLTSRLVDEGRRLDELVHHGVGVRPSIEIGYECLDDRARLLFRRLSVLETPDFARWVAGPLLGAELTEAEDVLESLVDVRLLDAERAGGQVRYRFHDLIRVYARERLVKEQQPDERREALRRVLSGWLFLAEQAHRRVYGGSFTVLRGDTPRWTLPSPVVDHLLDAPLDWLENERLALIAAVRQAADAGFDELCWELAMMSVALFETRSYHDDWRTTHEVAFAAARRAGNLRGEAAMLYSLGALSLVDQRFPDAATRLEAALPMFEALRDEHGVALTLRNLAYLDRVHGELDRALARYEESLNGLRTAGDRMGEAHVISGIAQIRLERHDPEGAQRILSDALAVMRVNGSRRIEAQLRHRLGEARLAGGDLSGAADAFRAALLLVRESADAVGEAFVLFGLGTVQAGHGRNREAKVLLVQSLELTRQTGDRLLAGRILVTIGELRRTSGDAEGARDCLLAALDQLDGLGATPWRSRALRLLGALPRADSGE